MMDLESLISAAQGSGASDLHLEPGLPAALRIRGTLRTSGEPLPAKPLLDIARSVIGEDNWPGFLERRSCDLSRTIAGVRCRINVLQTSRGVGLAIRLLASFQATVEKLNLHPDLKKLITHPTGLVLVSGPTGCGKSSTLAALIQEINREILIATHAVKNFIRNRDFFKISSFIETGAEHGMWTFQRYRNWLDKRTNFYIPGPAPEPPDSEPAQPSVAAAGAFAPIGMPEKARREKIPAPEPALAPTGSSSPRIEIEPEEGKFGKILKRAK